jgi:hypothetical protein
MLGRFVLNMAFKAVCRPSRLVVEDRIPPCGCIMALGTLSREVIGGLVLEVTGLAVLSSSQGVVKMQVAPRGCSVAGRAVSGKVICRCINCMTGLALLWSAGVSAIGVASAAVQSSVLPGKREECMLGTCASW